MTEEGQRRVGVTERSDDLSADLRTVKLDVRHSDGHEKSVERQL